MTPFLRRFVVLAVGTALFAASTWLVLRLAGLLPGYELELAGLRIAVEPTGLGWTGVAPALAALGLALTVLALWMPATGDDDDWHVLAGAGGTDLPGSVISISGRSLRGLVARLGAEVEGVLSVEPRVRLKKDGWVVRCTVHTWPKTPLPELRERLGDHLREALEDLTGVPVTTLRIDIEHGLARSERRRVA